MPQDRKSGAAARRWGLEIARKIILFLHGEPLSDSDNKCLIGGETLVVKCAKPKTMCVGVSYKMLNEIDGVIGAFARNAQEFDLYKMTVDQYRDHINPTISRRSHANIGYVLRNVFEEIGEDMGLVKIPGKKKLRTYKASK
jgi:hypothetical protein